MPVPPRTVRPAEPPVGTLVARSLGDEVRMGPKEGRELVFGRNRPEVHLCVGEDDPRVSRRHGTLTCRAGQWWLRNLGSLGIRVSESELITPGAEALPLVPGYTSLTIEGRAGRLHVVEVQVSGPDGAGRGPQHRDRTLPVRAWPLDLDERRVVVALAQDYLRNEPDPYPASWQRVATVLRELDPDRAWTEKKAEHKVRGLRLRLDAAGVAGLVLRDEVGGSGDALKVKLIKELISSNTIGPRDLALLDGPDR